MHVILNLLMLVVVTGLLSWPLVGYFVLALMFIGLLGSQVRAGRGMQFSALSLACLVASIYRDQGISYARDEVVLLKSVPLLMASFLFARMAIEASWRAKKAQLTLANEAGKGHFTDELGFGSPHDGCMVYLDPKTRHIAIVHERSFRVEPFEFLKGWQVLGVPQGNRHSWRLELTTYEMEQPIVHAYMPNRATADAWAERLENVIHNWGKTEQGSNGHQPAKSPGAESVQQT